MRLAEDWPNFRSAIALWDVNSWTLTILPGGTHFDSTTQSFQKHPDRYSARFCSDIHASHINCWAGTTPPRQTIIPTSLPNHSKIMPLGNLPIIPQHLPADPRSASTSSLNPWNLPQRKSYNPRDRRSFHPHTSSIFTAFATVATPLPEPTWILTPTTSQTYSTSSGRGVGVGEPVAGPRSALEALGVIASAQIEYISYVFITTALAERAFARERWRAHQRRFGLLRPAICRSLLVLRSRPNGASEMTEPAK